MGEEKKEEEAQLAEEGIKEQVSLERKEESKLSFQVFSFFHPRSVLMQAPLKMLFAPGHQHHSISHLKQVLCVQFRFNLSSSYVLHIPLFFFFQSTH